MKRLLLTIFFIFLVTPVVAATATPSATPQDEKTQQIEDLKDRLATKVAELRQSKRMAVYGTVKSVSISTFVVETKTKDFKIELTDDLKVFQMLKGKRTTLKPDNIEKDDIVTVFGEYDTTLELLQGKIVFIQAAAPIQITGTVKETNKSDYTVTVQTAEGQTFIVDFETTTKTNLWNGASLEKGGFSTFIVGDTVFVTGSAVPKKENRISATRITDIPPQVRGAATTITPTKISTPSATATPSAK